MSVEIKLQLDTGIERRTHLNSRTCDNLINAQRQSLLIMPKLLGNGCSRTMAWYLKTKTFSL